MNDPVANKARGYRSTGRYPVGALHTEETETAGMVWDEARETGGVPVGHIAKEKVDDTGIEGSRVGTPNRIDDHAGTLVADHTKSTVEERLVRSEIERDLVSESQTKKNAED